MHPAERHPGGRIDRWWQANPRRQRSLYPMVMADSGVATWDASKRKYETKRAMLEGLIETAAARGSSIELQARFETLPDGRGELVVELENQGQALGEGTEPTLGWIRYGAWHVRVRDHWRTVRMSHGSASRSLGRLAAGERRTIRPGLIVEGRDDWQWSGAVVFLERRAESGGMAWEAMQSDVAEWEPAGTPTPRPTATASSTVTPWPTPTPFATLPWDIVRQAAGSDNPYYVTTRLGRDQDWRRAATPTYYTAAIYAFRDRDAAQLPDDLEAQVPIADFSQIGPVHGLAFDRKRRVLYAGARQEGLPPAAGHGTIYRLDLETGRSEAWLNLPADPVGPTPRPYSRVWDAGLGDLELDPDSGQLFAVNLSDQRIYRIDGETGQVLGSFPAGGQQTASPENRPFALAWHEGWLYHGLIRSPPSPPADPKAAPMAYVYRSRPDGSELEQVASIDMGYARSTQPWERWDSSNWTSPVLADLELDHDGNLLIGLRPSDWPVTGGDLLVGRPEAPGRWRVDTTLDFFEDDFGRGEDLTGSLALAPGGRRAVSSAQIVGRDDCDHARAVVWLDRTTGRRDGPRGGLQHLSVSDCEGAAPSGDIELFDLPPRVSPTPRPASTSTPSRPIATPNPEPTAVTTLIPGRRPWPTLYLPYLARGDCQRSRPLDIVLLVDTSTSMRQPTAEGRSKLAAVQESLRRFTQRLESGSQGARATAAVRIGLIAFNQGVTVLAPLGAEAAGVRRAIGELDGQVAPGTRLDLALATGSRALDAASEEGPRRHAVLVLLTDGLHSGPASREQVLDEAERARQHGAEIYALGLGDPDPERPAEGFDADLLLAIAGHPDRFVGTPGAQALVSIFEALADRLSCPVGPGAAPLAGGRSATVRDGESTSPRRAPHETDRPLP